MRFLFWVMLVGCGSDASLSGTVRGVSCWDLDSDGDQDPEEDTTGDGVFDAADCRGADGAPGANGAAGDVGATGAAGATGATGLSCWDLDGDGATDPEEDRTGDGVWDALDCQGADGRDGVDGAPGADGRDGVDGAPGADGRDGVDGAPGADGRDGADGADGADGRDGLSCWDLDADGVRDTAEDINADGAWDTADCQSSTSGGSLDKSLIYGVTGGSGSTSTAACDDNDDVLITGGCQYQESCIPAHFTGIPRYNDDSSRPAEWYCALNCGTVTARGFCLDVH